MLVHCFCMQLLRLRGHCKLSGLKVILISTFETWGARWLEEPIVDIDRGFSERLPLASAFEQYALENEFSSVADRSGVWLRIVSCGLIYGGDGLDLKDAFMYGPGLIAVRGLC
jgi:hypothetical protein